MASPTILVTGQVPTSSPATALAGRTVTATVDSVDQLVARIAEQRRVGIQPAVQIVYRESSWNKVVAPAAVATILPAILATLAELTGHHATSQALVVVAVLLAALTGAAVVMDRIEWSR